MLFDIIKLKVKVPSLNEEAKIIETFNTGSTNSTSIGS